MHNSIRKYNIWVILLFVFQEVYFFGSSVITFQLLSTLFFYSYILYSYFKDRKMGIMYLLSFSLLALNMSNYLQDDSLPMSFYGLRFLGFSFNIIFTFVLFVIDFYLDAKNRTIRVKLPYVYKYISVFIIYSALLGIVNVVLGKNYMDNYSKDLITYLPFFVYIYLISKLEKEELFLMLKNMLIGTFFLMMTSLAFEKYRQYALGEDALLINTIGSVFMIAIFFAKNIMHRFLYYTILILYFYLLTTGLVLIGGKTIIYVLLILLWLLIKQRNVIYIILPFVFIFYSKDIFTFFIGYFGEGVIANKFAQVSLIFSGLKITDLALIPASVGNLTAELLTLIDYLSKNIYMLLLGKGFGGGIPDSLNYLKPWVHRMGYAYIDSVRNDYHKFHLAIYEILIKSGVFSLIVYTLICIKGFFSKNKWKGLYVVFFLLMFSVSKEFILLTLFLYELSTKTETKNTNIVSK